MEPPQQSPSNIFSLDAVVNEEANRNIEKPEKGLIKSLQHNIERCLAQANGQDLADSGEENMFNRESKQSQSIPSNPNNEAI